MQEKHRPILAQIWMPPGNGKIVYRAIVVSDQKELTQNGSEIRLSIYEWLVTGYTSHSFDAPRLDEKLSNDARDAALEFLAAELTLRKQRFGLGDEDFEPTTEVVIDLRNTAAHIIKKAAVTV